MTTEQFPLSAAGKIHHNNAPVELIEAAIRRGEARFASTGALMAVTGEHTGRSVKDKFTVRDEVTEGKIWWDNNFSMSRAHFETLLQEQMSAESGSMSTPTPFPAPARIGRIRSSGCSGSGTPFSVSCSKGP